MNRIMRRIAPSTLACMLAAVVCIGCSGSAESDGRRLAELQCKATKLASKAQSGDMSVLQESIKISAEAAELAKTFEEKYTSDSDKEKLRDAYLKALQDCK